MKFMKNKIVVFLFFVIVFFLLYFIYSHRLTSITPKKEPEKTKETKDDEYTELLKKAEQLIYSERDYDKALDIINKLESTASLDDSKLAAVIIRKVHIYESCNKFELAEKELKKALALNVTPQQRVYILSSLSGVCSLKEKNRRIAMEYIREAEEIIKKENLQGNFPGEFEFYLNKGTLLLDKGDYPQAAICLKKAAEMKPDNAEIIIDLAYALFRGGQVDEARKMAKRWFKLKHLADHSDVNEPEIKMDIIEDLTRYYIIVGDYKKALKTVESSNKVKGVTCSMDPELACLYYSWGKYEKTETVLKRIINDGHSDIWEKDISRGMLKSIADKRKRN